MGPDTATRLKWRCRRGARELDLVLEGWLEAEYPTAPLRLQRAFEALLQREDPVLYDLLLGRTVAATTAEQELVDALRERMTRC